MALPTREVILPLSYDFVLKAVLTHPDARPALMDLISAAIGREVVSVDVRNNELPAMDVDEKNERLDVNCVINDGDQVDVEMQGSPLEEIAGGHENIVNKSIYYLTDLHSSQKSKGVEYYALKRTYQITFSVRTVFPNYAGYASYIQMRRDDGTLVTDQLSLILVELSKLRGARRKPVGEMTALEMWSIFMGYADKPRHRKLVNEIISRREAIAVAAEVLRTISKDEHARAKNMSRRKFETDTFSNLATAEERGRRAGRAEGRAEGHAEGLAEGHAEGLAEGHAEGAATKALHIAQNMRSLGIPVDTIVAATGLTREEIEKLSVAHATTDCI